MTGGTHTGVMKHVGNAIHKHNTTKSNKVNKKCVTNANGCC